MSKAPLVSKTKKKKKQHEILYRISGVIYNITIFYIFIHRIKIKNPSMLLTHSDNLLFEFTLPLIRKISFD